MAGVYSVDGSRGGISDREKRFTHPPDLAPEGGAGLIAYFCLFFGLCFMEDAGPDGQECRFG